MAIKMNIEKIEGAVVLGKEEVERILGNTFESDVPISFVIRQDIGYDGVYSTNPVLPKDLFVRVCIEGKSVGGVSHKKCTEEEKKILDYVVKEVAEQLKEGVAML